MFGIEHLPEETRDPTVQEENEAVRMFVSWDNHPELPSFRVGSKCISDVREFKIADNLPEEKFINYCGCSPYSTDKVCKHIGGALACSRARCWGKHSVRQRCYERPVIFVHEKAKNVPVAHEFGHILSQCSKDYDGAPSDVYHLDKRIWCENGVTHNAGFGTIGRQYCEGE